MIAKSKKFESTPKSKENKNATKSLRHLSDDSQAKLHKGLIISILFFVNFCVFVTFTF